MKKYIDRTLFSSYVNFGDTQASALVVKRNTNITIVLRKL